MPTPPSTPLPEIGSAAAPLVPDLPITFVKNVTAFALPDMDAAEQPASALQRALCLLKRSWRVLQQERQRHRLRIALLRMNERQLKDIGITGADIGYIAAHRNIERLRDGTVYPWMR